MGPRVDAGTAREHLLERFPALGDEDATDLDLRFAHGEIVRTDGSAWGPEERLRPGDVLWFHRELRAEDVPEIELPVLLQDEHLLVIDKPHDMATIPRGVHVLSSALARLRRLSGIAELVPLHRLDRRTAGVLAFGIRPEERAAYQTLFARGEVRKEYRALVAWPEGEDLFPSCSVQEDGTDGELLVLRDRLVKNHGELIGRVLPGEPNALTRVQVLEATGRGEGRRALLQLLPATGRTHQLRLQLSSRGRPIMGEDLYPQPIGGEAAPPMPLQLLARALSFTDPVTGQERRLCSGRELQGADAGESSAADSPTLGS